MDIHSKKGTKVIFNHLTAGYTHHQIIAKKHLEAGKEYTVDHTEIGNCHTDVYLQEVSNVAFNSVMFDNKKD